MKKFPFQGVKIDWPNHVIGFFSALFGILIAFELDEWRERQNQLELAATAFERMKVEIEFNQNVLHTNVKQNLEMISMLHRFSEQINEQLLFIGSLKDADSVNNLFTGYLYINTEESDRKSNTFPAHIGIGSLPVIAQHSSAWESAKATGVLNFMGYEKVLGLSSIYNNTNILDELSIIKQLIKRSSEITTKTQLVYFLSDIEESLRVIERELIVYDQFVSMVKSME